MSAKPKNAFRVLIVDDQSSDIMNPYLLTSQLGFETTLAFDGEQALTESARTPFDLIILDWNMPRVPGWAFLRRLEMRPVPAGRKEIKNQNIVLYSGDDLSDLIFDDLLNLRVLDVWQKPLEPSDMLKRIKRIKAFVGG